MGTDEKMETFRDSCIEAALASNAASDSAEVSTSAHRHDSLPECVGPSLSPFLLYMYMACMSFHVPSGM